MCVGEEKDTQTQWRHLQKCNWWWWQWSQLGLSCLSDVKYHDSPDTLHLHKWSTYYKQTKRKIKAGHSAVAYNNLILKVKLRVCVWVKTDWALAAQVTNPPFFDFPDNDLKIFMSENWVRTNSATPTSPSTLPLSLDDTMSCTCDHISKQDVEVQLKCSEVYGAASVYHIVRVQLIRA